MAYAQPVNYQAVDAGAGPEMGWGDGIFGCFNDMQVCLMGAFPLGCVQYLYATNAAAAGTEEFQPAILKMLGFTLLIPNVLAAVASAVPSAAASISPLNTLNQLALAYYGMSSRQALRKKFNIRGTTDCAMCGCFSFACDGDEEKIDDFCAYLYCFPCAVCQETRHMRRYNLGNVSRHWKPYNGPFPPGPGGHMPPRPPVMGIPVAPIAPVAEPTKEV